MIALSFVLFSTRWLVAAALVVFLANPKCSVIAAELKNVPLQRAHAHNDYEHPRPLLDALDHGFCSVEADIYLVDGRLLVAHDLNKVSPTRTLQNLYLDPLRDRIRKNEGKVHRNGPPVILLIDIKSEAEMTYRALRVVLKEYSDVLTTFGRGWIQTNAITVILSGNRPRESMKAELLRYAAFDGRLDDLDGDEPSAFIPLVSENWTKIFQWRGQGPMADAEQQKLRALVQRAHAQGRKIRFWATPDRPVVWKELLEAEVDLINTDDLAGLEAFLIGQTGPNGQPDAGPVQRSK